MIIYTVFLQQGVDLVEKTGCIVGQVDSFERRNNLAVVTEIGYCIVVSEL
ncbi:hypothetical protein RRM63_002159 [Photobacterium damselae]|nr:hypothetical protein [Photobacterium damselae]